MAILVAGLGYIGAALTHRLLDRGDDVVAVENFFSTPREAVTSLTAHARLSLVEGSVADEDTWERAFGAETIDRVFYLAGQASAHPSAGPIAYTQETNYRGPRLLIEACRRSQVQSLVCASSTRLYRTPLPRLVSEQSPLHATDLVHLSQLYGEILLTTYAAADRNSSREVTPVSMVAARLGIVHGLGPVMKYSPVFLAVPQRFCQQAAAGELLRASTGPHSFLPFVHISDAVDGLITCLDLPPGVHIVNVAAEARSVADVARVVQEAGQARGLHVEVEYAGPRRPYAERRVTSRLAGYGFAATRTLEGSLAEVLDYYLARSALEPAAGSNPIEPAISTLTGALAQPGDSDGARERPGT